MKGYKVTDRSRAKLVGIACNTLGELVAKGRQKLALTGEVTLALEDGTIVDDEDYFRALPPQTVIVFYRKHEEIVTGVDFVLNVLRRVNSSYLETGSKAKGFLLEKTKELMEILKENEKEMKEDVRRNTPAEDPEWFAGLETNSRTKDEYMYRKSQDRIRGYLYKFQDDVRRNKRILEDDRCRKLVQDCLTFFKNRLKADGYFGCYFDRRCAGRSDARGEVVEPARKKLKEDGTYSKSSYCDSSGNFVCQGKWKSETCDFVNEHRINPYMSREARILFSTWNLDHRIEKSRTVVPSLVEAVRTCGKCRSVNFLYFYELLFTKVNLKLVHVVCHDKSIHDVSSDSRYWYA